MATGLVEIVNSTAVTRHNTLESPFVAQDMLQIARVATTGFAVDGLVGTHHLLDLGFLYQSLEGWQIGFP